MFAMGPNLKHHTISGGWRHSVSHFEGDRQRCSRHRFSCALSVFVLHYMQVDCNFPKVIIIMLFYSDDIDYITNDIMSSRQYEVGCHLSFLPNDENASPLLTCQPPLHPLVAERV